MSEEKQTELPAAVAKAELNTRSELPADSMLERADSIAKRLEAANLKAEELVKRNEAVAARIMLSGRADAGAAVKTPEQLEEEAIEAEAQRALKRFR